METQQVPVELSEQKFRISPKWHWIRRGRYTTTLYARCMWRRWGVVALYTLKIIKLLTINNIIVCIHARRGAACVGCLPHSGGWAVYLCAAATTLALSWIPVRACRPARGRGDRRYRVSPLRRWRRRGKTSSPADDDNRPSPLLIYTKAAAAPMSELLLLLLCLFLLCRSRGYWTERRSRCGTRGWDTSSPYLCRHLSPTEHGPYRFWFCTVRIILLVRIQHYYKTRGEKTHLKIWGN